MSTLQTWSLHHGLLKRTYNAESTSFACLQQVGENLAQQQCQQYKGPALFQSLIEPILMYRAETWTLKGKFAQKTHFNFIGSSERPSKIMNNKKVGFCISLMASWKGNSPYQQ